jgi:hypothetical protein
MKSDHMQEPVYREESTQVYADDAGGKTHQEISKPQ